MHQHETERIVIREKSIEEFRSKIDEATAARIIDSLSEDTYTEKDGTVIHRAIIVRSVKSHLVE